MAISEHPDPGTILLCDFTQGFTKPEMPKRRPVIVLSPKIGARPGLCTVVALSASDPEPVMPYHMRINIDPPLPVPCTKETWVKGDMVNAVGFHRLDLIRLGRSESGKRLYRYNVLTNKQMKDVRSCLLRSLGLSMLTKHL